ncbi:MAG: hypothetical protein QOE11_1711 [Solirubrobacteraceae bacterium]|jgi:hypothetical protein|nr:hypothetical protein [Solirubrobacteraceae bacterium]
MARARIVAMTAALVFAAPGVLSAASSSAATKRLYAFMDGRFTTHGGDTDGHARIGMSFDRARGRVCFDLRKFKLETPSAAHIHRASKGRDGPVVVTLFRTPTGAGRGKVTGCAGGVSRATIDAILARPSAYYADLHTQAYPRGSVRGQLTTRKLV